MILREKNEYGSIITYEFQCQQCGYVAYRTTPQTPPCTRCLAREFSGQNLDRKCDTPARSYGDQRPTCHTSDKKTRESWGRYRHSHTCEICGQVFLSNRRHSRTCSDVCRKRLSRRDQ